MDKNTITLKQLTEDEKEVTLVRPDGHPCVMRQSRARIALKRKGWKKYDQKEKSKLQKTREKNLNKVTNSKTEIENLKKKLEVLESKNPKS